MLEELKIDLKNCLKYLYKLLREVRRIKIFLFSLSYVVSFLCFEDKPFIFQFAFTILLYNILYVVYSKIKQKIGH